MRPLELLVLVHAVAWSLSLLTRAGRNRRWLAILVISSGATILAQASLEGYRSHLLPMYAMVLIGVTWGAWASSERADQPPRGIRRVAGALGLLAALAVSATLPAWFPVFEYPEPTGPFAIGTVTLVARDSSRHELLAADPSRFREIAFQVWYPARPVAGAPTVPAFEAPGPLQDVLAIATGLPAPLFDHLRFIRSRAVRGAAVDRSEPRRPVLLYSPGFTATRTTGLSQVQELVSHGYIVVGIDHTYYSAVSLFPDGHTVAYAPALGWPTRVDDRSRHYYDEWAADARCVLDALHTVNAGGDPAAVGLRGAMDLDRVGYLGTSSGGCAVTRTLFLDPRFKAGVAQDGSPYEHDEVVQSGLRQPFLYMQSEEPYGEVSDKQLAAWGVTPAEWQDLRRERPRRVDRLFASLSGPGYVLRIGGTKHLSFGDALLIIAVPGLVNEPPARAQAIVNAYTMAFFDRYLRGKSEALLAEEHPRRFPEVTLRRRHG